MELWRPAEAAARSHSATANTDEESKSCGSSHHLWYVRCCCVRCFLPSGGTVGVLSGNCERLLWFLQTPSFVVGGVVSV